MSLSISFSTMEEEALTSKTLFPPFSSLTTTSILFSPVQCAYCPERFQGKFPLWCERGDLNPHPIWDWILSPARLPVPPPSQKIYFIIVIYDNQREKSR